MTAHTRILRRDEHRIRRAPFVADRHGPLLGERDRNLALVDILREVGSRHGRSPGEVAIAWTLQNPAVTGAIVGARSAEQVEGWVGAASLQLDASDMARIDAA